MHLHTGLNVYTERAHVIGYIRSISGTNFIFFLTFIKVQVKVQGNSKLDLLLGWDNNMELHFLNDRGNLWMQVLW